MKGVTSWPATRLTKIDCVSAEGARDAPEASEVSRQTPCSVCRRLSLIFIMLARKNGLTAVWQPEGWTVLIWLDGLNTEINKYDLPRNKTVSRVSLCPKSKEVTCILSVESLWNSSFHRRFLADHAKSPARVNLEILVGAKLSIERKAVRLKLFVETVPEATKTWWKTKVLWIREQFLIPRRKTGWHRQRSVRRLVCGSILWVPEAFHARFPVSVKS